MLLSSTPPAPRPVATWREARELLRGLGAKGTLREDQVKKMLRSGPLRTLQNQRLEVSAAVAMALRRMQEAGELEVVHPQHKSRTRWGRPEHNRPSRLDSIALKLRRWIAESTKTGRRITVSAARSQFKKQHKEAGGCPRDLTCVIKDQLRHMAFRGELLTDPGASVLLNLFSGGQSSEAPATASGLTPIHVDIMEEYPVGPGKKVRVRESTDLRSAPDRMMIPWVAGREALALEGILVVAAAVPCHTWTHLDATLRPAGNSYRLKSGKPNTSHPAKAREAKEQTELAQNVALSIFEWICQGAYMGVQRYFWLENGAWGKLGEQTFMEVLPEPRVLSYCMYRTALHEASKFPTQKDTKIWTNLRGWEPRYCNHRGPHQGHLGGRSDCRPQAQNMSKWATKRWTPEELIWDLLSSLRHRPLTV